MRETIALIRRTPGTALLLFGNFAMTFGANLVTPYLAVYLITQGHFSPWAVGAALTTRLWAQQGLMIVGGRLADRFGAVPTMCTGLLVRVVSCLMLAWLVQPVWVIIACGLLGLGSALYIPSSKATLAVLVGPGAARTSIFAMRSAANNAGAALGPLAGGLLLVFNARTGFMTAAALFLALVPGLWRLRHRLRATLPVKTAKAATPSDAREGIRHLLRNNPRLIWVLCTAIAFGFCYVQIEYALPLTAAAVQSAAFVGVLFSVNAICVVVLQFVVTGPLARFDGSVTVIALGLAAMAAGFGLMAHGSIAGLILGVIMFSLGEVIIDPRLDGEIAAIVGPTARATVFGLVGVCIALGGAVANGLASSPIGPVAGGSRYWLILAATGAALALLVRVTAPARPQPVAPAKSASISV